MADLVTHAAVAWLLRRALGRLPMVGVFVAGSIWPDAVSRVPAILFTAARDRGLPVPDALLVGFEPLHTPVGMVVAAAALALLFREDQRRAVFTNLLGGMALHLLLDLLQDHMGVGYQLLFPFSGQVWELGLVGSEASVVAAGPLALLVLLGILWDRWGLASREGDNGG